MPIRDFIGMIGQSCQRWCQPGKYRSCGIGCDDLIYMFAPPPATDEFAREQNEGFAKAKG